MNLTSMKPVRIKDNEYNKKSYFIEIPNIANTIADKTLEQLEKEGIFVFPEMIKETEDLTKDQIVLQGINDSYRSSNVMGFLGCGDERLIISSRFSSGDDDFFLQYMLEKVLECPNLISLETECSRNDKLLPILLFLFPSYLKSAIRKGIFKTYVHKEYNDDDVKGVIDIDRHIRKNIPFIGKIAYSQREFVYNNYLVQLIRHTIEYIRRKPYGNSVLSKAKEGVKLIIDATPDYHAKDTRNIIIENRKNTVRHAYYHEYQKLQKLCLLILQNENPLIGYGSKKVFGVLFDGAWLWEEYIAQLLGEDRFYHPMNKACSGVQYLFSVKKGPIYPDFIGVNSENRIIADAKYKPEDNISNKDYLQVLAYMYRFEAKRGCYLYPEIEEAEDTVLWLNGGVSYEGKISRRDDIFVVKHGLKIPGNSSSYEEFISEMLINERLFVYKLDMRFSADVIICDE